MAICFARLQYVKRTAKKNMVCKAAYNGRLRLEFEGTHLSKPETYDWTLLGQSDKPLKHLIVIPSHVNTSFNDPTTLWNSVEQFEKRKDAQVGLEFLLALPDDHVISHDMRCELAISFANKYFVSKGYGVQIDVHAPSNRKSYQENEEEQEPNEKNYHAHFLLTPRHFNEAGNDFNPKKSNDLHPEVKGSKKFAINGIEWSKLWTQFQNEYFEKHGLDLRVDQTCSISQIHLGPVRMRSKRSNEILSYNDERGETGKLISKDPNVILQRLTENKSVFQPSDLEIYLTKYVPFSEIEAVRNEFWKCQNLIQLFDKETNQAKDKFSSVQVIEEEKKIARLADRIYQQRPKTALNEPSQSLHLNQEQKAAYEAIIKGEGLSCIEGLAGTGKSYLLVALKNHYEANGYKVRAFGPDNATVKVLQEKGFADASNVHRFLFKSHFSKKGQITPKNEIWIIDEASKLGNTPLLELLKAAEKNEVKLIFSGNSAQLNSIERGGFFKIFCDQYGYVFLKDIQRQETVIHRDISRRLALGDVSRAVDIISGSGGFVWSSTREQSLIRLVDKWAEDSLHFPYSTSLILAHTNKEVRQINDLIHTVRKSRKEISETEFECSTIFGKIRVSEGDFIEFRENSKDLKVFNGQRGVLITAAKDRFTLAVEGKLVSFNPQKFTSFQLAYATTYFRSQGSTFDRTYIHYTQAMNQKLLYVAMSRHVKNVHCFVPLTEASCLAEIKRQVLRNKETENTLSYTNLSEISEMQKLEKRKKSIDGLCDSSDLLSLTKGYGFKAWDTLSTKFGSYVEKIQDRQSNDLFYDFSSKQSQNGGRVVEIKEEGIAANLKDNNTPLLQKADFTPIKQNGFQKLPEEKKNLYRDYFDKSEKASALYAIVKAEASGSSIKETASSFADWQKACHERNESAYELLRKGRQCKSILGNKSFEILEDRAKRHEHRIEPKDSLELQLKENMEHLLYNLFPEGPQRRDSRGFRFGSNGSLAVTCIGEKKGCYYDFEKSEGGGLLTLIGSKKGLNFDETKTWARKFLSESMGKEAPTHFSTRSFKAKDSNWISIIPPNQIVPNLSNISTYLDEKYNLASSHPYFNPQGDLVCYTLRLEPKNGGKKIVLPLSYGKNLPDTMPSWSLRRYSGEISLYNSQYLNQTKPILVVEGEKTADSAQKLMGSNYIVVSWLGGAGAAKEANWGALYGRDVVIWPDNDAAGYKAANDIAESLRQVGVKSLKMITQESLKDLPNKWDLADPLPSEKSENFIRNTILRAKNSAIGIDKIKHISERNGVGFQELNSAVCAADILLRSDLEKKYGAKTSDIESEIITEALKSISNRCIRNPKSCSHPEKNTDKSMVRTRSNEIELN